MREAVARCPLCSHTYCRECITDYEGRMLCASCLSTHRGKKEKGSGFGWRGLGMLGFAGLGLALSWLLFYLLAVLLLRIPAEFHEGRFWQ